MSEFVKEYGKAILAIIAGLIGMALLFLVISGGSFSGLGKGLDEKFVCEYPTEQELTFKAVNGVVPLYGDFDWKDYIVAEDGNGNSLLNHVQPEGEIDVFTPGIQTIGFSLQYRNHTERVYSILIVQDVETLCFAVNVPSVGEIYYEFLPDMTWGQWKESQFYNRAKRYGELSFTTMYHGGIAVEDDDLLIADEIYNAAPNNPY